MILKGLKFYNQHSENQVDGADVVVYSLAVGEDNVELIKAKQLKKAIFKRSELLGVILNSYKRSVGISGSHGKTTSSSMLSEILRVNNKKVTSLIGGESVNFGSTLISNKNEIIVGEICEYAKSILDVKVDYPACLNIDNDHLDCYKDINSLKNAFYSYLDNGKTKFINVDDKYLSQYKSKNTIGIGVENDCNYKAVNLTNQNGCYSFQILNGEKLSNRVTLKVLGKHNVYNALTAVAIANYAFKIDINKCLLALEDFKGVKRRFELVKEINGKKIFCDYAHHPTEIEKIIETAKDYFNEDFLIVFQPHTYSRTKILWKDFIRVLNNQNLILFKEYPAREKLDKTATSKALASNLKNAQYISNFKDLFNKIKRCKYNYVLVLGAGDIYDKIIKTDN